MKLRGLFLKIFGILWLAQSLIFIISTTQIVRQRFPSPSTLADALDSNLQFDGEEGIRAYDNGGCLGFANQTRHEPSGAMLLNSAGDVVCRSAPALALPGLIPQFRTRIEGRQVGGGYVWLVPVTSKTGARYEYVWFQPPLRRPEHRFALLRYAFPQLPVAIAIGGLTTFALVLLFSRPLVRLRKATRALAEGDLTARVETSSAHVESHSDELQGLAHDFNHMAERLESLVGAQRLLLRDVSHELRSPLSRLSVALELAREDATPALLPHLARIEREGEKLNQLIGELLTLSSLETVEGASLFTEVSLSQLCEQLLPDAEYEAQRRPCTVVLDQGEEECVVRGNWHLLHRAVENVVRNAIRYTEAGTQVRICVKRSHGSAVIEITDCGPGIPESETQNIFRPFYRLDYARSATTGGFGVGLAITDRAVKLHGGKLTAVTSSNGGTCIRMTFP